MKGNEINRSEDEELLNLISADHERGLTRLYKTYKGEFLSVARRFGGDESIHVDCYHDAVLAFFEILIEGRYEAERASVKTLLFTIGKYKVYSRLRQAGREPLWEDLENIGDLVVPDTSERMARESAVAGKAIATLGAKCRRIIELFYYRRLTIAEIMKVMEYKNENVVKAHKSRCMKSLRESAAKIEQEEFNQPL